MPRLFIVQRGDARYQSSKGRDEVATFTFDWSRLIPGDVIVASTWSMFGGVVGMASTISGLRSSVIVAGGNPLRGARIRNEITTAAGRTLRRHIDLRVMGTNSPGQTPAEPPATINLTGLMIAPASALLGDLAVTPGAETIILTGALTSPGSVLAGDLGVSTVINLTGALVAPESVLAGSLTNTPGTVVTLAGSLVSPGAVLEGSLSVDQIINLTGNLSSSLPVLAGSLSVIPVVTLTGLLRSPDAELAADIDVSGGNPPTSGAQWTFSTNFEPGSASLTEVYSGGAATTAQAYSGTRSMSLPVPASGHMGATQILPEHVERYGEIWFRVRTRMPASPPYNYTTDEHLKWMRLHMCRSNGAHRGYIDVYLNNEGNSISFKFIVEGADDGRTNVWSKTISSAYAPVRGQWETYELYVKFDSVLIANGGQARIRFWKNGLLRSDITNLITQNHLQVGDYIDEARFSTFWNPAGAPVAQTMHTDDWYITTVRPETLDAAGNPYIGMDTLS